MSKFKQFLVSFAAVPCAFLLLTAALVVASNPVVAAAQAPVVTQGMITAIGDRQVAIGTQVVTHDGDTVITYNDGLTALAVGQLVNYTYTVDVDGVFLATTMDVFAAQPVSGTERVKAINVDNATSIVSLSLSSGLFVDFYQPSAIFAIGAGTRTSYGCQLVSYSGHLNPASGHINASTTSYMADIPVDFLSPATAFTVGTPTNFFAIDTSSYGMPCLLSVTAVGLPAGMTQVMGSISGTPTVPGTYEVLMTATYGQYSVNAYSTVSAPITIVVDSVVVPPADTIAPVITMEGTDVTIAIDEFYNDFGATCTDNVDTACVVTAAGMIEESTPGIYTITYTAVDAAGNVATPVVRTVTVAAPVVVTPVIDPLVVVTPVIEPAVAVCSGIDQVITNAASRNGIVEINGGPANGGLAVQLFQNSTTIVAPLTATTFFQVGNIISFVGTLTANTLCVTTSATVSAPADIIAPVITMIGTGATITAGGVYADAGATCADNFDATCAVTVTSTVDTTTAGSYTVTYTAADAAGNVATPVVRTILVQAPVDEVVSTGIKAEAKGVITAVTPTTITVGTTVVRITAATTFFGKSFKIGTKVEYKGVKNTDGSVTATIVKAR